MQERTTYPQGSRAGDGLCDGDAVLLDGLRVGAVGEEGGGFGEGRDTRDASVFLVESRRDDLLFGSADGGEYVRLALVVACRNR